MKLYFNLSTSLSALLFIWSGLALASTDPRVFLCSGVSVFDAGSTGPGLGAQGAEASISVMRFFLTLAGDQASLEDLSFSAWDDSGKMIHASYPSLLGERNYLETESVVHSRNIKRLLGGNAGSGPFPAETDTVHFEFSAAPGLDSVLFIDYQDWLGYASRPAGYEFTARFNLDYTPASQKSFLSKQFYIGCARPTRQKKKPGIGIKLRGAKGKPRSRSRRQGRPILRSETRAGKKIPRSLRRVSLRKNSAEPRGKNNS